MCISVANGQVNTSNYISKHTRMSSLWEYSLIFYPNLSVPLHHLPPVILYVYMRYFPAGAWLRTLSSAAVFSDSKMTQRACGGIEGRSFVSRSPQAHVFTLGPSHLMSQSRTPGIKNCGRINISHNVRVAGKGVTLTVFIEWFKDLSMCSETA